MNPRDAAILETRIRHEATSKVSLRPGHTNGRRCIHINDMDPKDPSRSSFTIYSEAEWDRHPLNRANRPTRASEARSEAQQAAEALPEPEATVEHVFRGALGLLDAEEMV